MSEPSLRQAVRALMIDPRDRILMMQLHFDDWTGWVLPGGGIEPGEDHQAALRRELAEEVGPPQTFVGPLVCRRRFLRDGFMGYDGQEDHIYLVPCHLFEPAPAMTSDELEAEGIVGCRWWSLDELKATEEVIRPEHLVELATQVLEHGAPPEPVVYESRS